MVVDGARRRHRPLPVRPRPDHRGAPPAARRRPPRPADQPRVRRAAPGGGPGPDGRPRDPDGRDAAGGVQGRDRAGGAGLSRPRRRSRRRPGAPCRAVGPRPRGGRHHPRGAGRRSSASWPPPSVPTGSRRPGGRRSTRWSGRVAPTPCDPDGCRRPVDPRAVGRGRRGGAQQGVPSVTWGIPASRCASRRVWTMVRAGCGSVRRQAHEGDGVGEQDARVDARGSGGWCRTPPDRTGWWR